MSPITSPWYLCILLTWYVLRFIKGPIETYRSKLFVFICGALCPTTLSFFLCYRSLFPIILIFKYILLIWIKRYKIEVTRGHCAPCYFFILWYNIEQESKSREELIPWTLIQDSFWMIINNHRILKKLRRCYATQCLLISQQITESLNRVLRT